LSRLPWIYWMPVILNPRDLHFGAAHEQPDTYNSMTLLAQAGVQFFAPMIARLIARSAFLKIGGMRS
jgi:hypothetical protein